MGLKIFILMHMNFRKVGGTFRKQYLPTNANVILNTNLVN